MRGNAAGNEITETDGETKLVSNEQREKWGEVWRLNVKKYSNMYLHVHLSDEDAGDAFGIVAFRVGRSKQLLTFPLLKAVEEGWVQDVLQHLENRTKTHISMILLIKTFFHLLRGICNLQERRN